MNENKSRLPISAKSDLQARYDTIHKEIDDFLDELRRHNRYKTYSGVYDDFIVDNRSGLIDLYDMSLQQDAHVKATVETLQSQMLGDIYSLGTIDSSGTFIVDAKETAKIQGNVFDNAVKNIIEAKLYGYTLLEIYPYFDPFTNKICHIKNFERRNVLCNQGQIITRVGDVGSKRYNILTDKNYIDNYVLVKTDDLGLFSATTPLVLAKKFAFGSYVNFTNTYGMPIIHGKSSEASFESKGRLANTIADAVNNRIIVTNKDDTIDVKSLSVSNSERIYIGLIEMINRDISNIILGSESMAGATQSYEGATKAHQDIFRDRISVYRKFTENVMNEQVIPRLVKMKYIKSGLIFKYNKRVDISIDEKIKLISLLLPHYEIPEEYIVNEFGISVTKKENPLHSGSASSDSSNTEREGRTRMSDEEYFKRYGKYPENKKKNNRANFLAFIKNKK